MIKPATVIRFLVKLKCQTGTITISVDTKYSMLEKLTDIVVRRGDIWVKWV